MFHNFNFWFFGWASIYGIIKLVSLVACVILFLIYISSRKNKNPYSNINTKEVVFDEEGKEIKPKKVLTKDSSNKMITGVCGGIAKYFDIDPSIVRIVAVILVLNIEVTFVAYIVAAVILPEE